MCVFEMEEAKASAEPFTVYSCCSDCIRLDAGLALLISVSYFV